jgi:hypothetical protein
VRRVFAADTPRCLDLPRETLPELQIVLVLGKNDFHRDVMAFWRGAQEDLAHPALA